MAAIHLISFGYLHAPAPPPADRVEDVRECLADPAAARAHGILDLTGTHPRVQAVVLATPGARDLLDDLTSYALSSDGTVTIAIGCAGGRHRSVALVELLFQRLHGHGRHVTMQHLHSHLPRVIKEASR